MICMILSICIAIGIIPLTAHFADITPDTSIEAIASQVRTIQEIYEDEPVSNRVIVKSDYNVNPLDSVAVAEGYNGLHILQFDNLYSAQKAVEYYRESKLVEYAQQDSLFSLNDETIASGGISFGDHLSWGSQAIGVDDYSDYLDDMTSLPEIIVGVIDTGVDLDHEFLKDRIIPTGYNISSSGAEDSEEDDKGHGTHVAGIIVDNTLSNVKIKAFKALNSGGKGSVANIIITLYAAIESGVNVINMSLSSKGRNKAIEEAVDTAINNNISVCVAAGNDGFEAENCCPAYISDCITVAAMDSNDSYPYWSNYGKCVDVIAPGVAIYSSYINGTYKSKSGTSMACPFVTAACALILSRDNTLSPEAVCSAIKHNGRSWLYMDTEKWQGASALCLATICDFDVERTSTPVFSYAGGKYNDTIHLELSCDDENSRIYYTTDGTRASDTNGTLYTQPISISDVTRVQAVAYSEGKIKSLQKFQDYYITAIDPESNFAIDQNGIITAYYGSNNYLTIPDTINGITVNGLGKKLFYFKDIVIIRLPDSVNYIGESCFRGCSKLISVEFNNDSVTLASHAFRGCEELREINSYNISSVGDYAFYNCQSLLEFVNEKIEYVSSYAFAYCSNIIYVSMSAVKSIDTAGFFDCASVATVITPELEVLGSRGFAGMLQISELKLEKLTTLCTTSGRGENFSNCEKLEYISLPSYRGEIVKECFYNCYGLEYAYLPLAVCVNDKSFYGCKSLNALYLPEVRSISSEITGNAVLFLTQAFEAATVMENYKYRIVAPSGSYAKSFADENGYPFCACDKCSFLQITNTGLEYNCGSCQESFIIASAFLKCMWRELMPVNKGSDFIPHAFLLDTVCDGTVNAKDYAIINSKQLQ